jgi:hypothetical protein
MPTTDEIATQPLPPIAVELLARINAAHAAIETWPRAFAEADVARVRLTLPAVIALSAFLEGHSQEAISIIGTIALEVWSGSDFYAEAGQSFIAGDLAGARTKWDSGNAAWARASVPAA